MGGYFLQEDPRDFDPEFFGISPLEAIQMDPQQRKLLEVVFESFESAGITLEDVSGANIGCYVGNFTYDFPVMQSRDTEYMHRYSATGLGATILSNRISHTFNLKGPRYVSLVQFKLLFANLQLPAVLYWTPLVLPPCTVSTSPAVLWPFENATVLSWQAQT